MVFVAIRLSKYHSGMPWISIIFLRELRASVYSVSKELSFCHSCNRPVSGDDLMFVARRPWYTYAISFEADQR